MMRRRRPHGSLLVRAVILGRVIAVAASCVARELAVQTLAVVVHRPHAR